MSLARVISRCLDGTVAPAISVEVHLSGGLPAFTIVGLPETAVRESRERVRAAILSSGFDFPRDGHITVNLAPGDFPKQGTRFDLAIALGILTARGQLPAANLDGCEFIAELALDGELRAVGAVLTAALAARDAGHELVVAPGDAAEAALIEGACIRSAGHLHEVCRHLLGAATLPRASLPAPPVAPAAQADLRDVVGQQRARRALEIAACGGHNVLFIGAPGTGKTMLASRLPGILPPLSEDEALATAAVHSVAGLPLVPGGWRTRPFRAPHHSASAAALIGGGRLPRPGEISLAHNGVLFLDEFPEFNRAALEALREPLESGHITISRAQRKQHYPAAFMLVAAMNPCPCGYAGDSHVACRCSPERAASYRARISGPLAERIDLHVEVPRQTTELMQASAPAAEPSAVVQMRVAVAQARQLRRQGCLNARLDIAGMARHCTLTRGARDLLSSALERLAFSARAYHKILRIARTLADMDDAVTLEPPHVAEAIGLRVLDRLGRGVHGAAR